jgi:hypothetical protein
MVMVHGQQSPTQRCKRVRGSTGVLRHKGVRDGTPAYNTQGNKEEQRQGVHAHAHS